MTEIRGRLIFGCIGTRVSGVEQSDQVRRLDVEVRHFLSRHQVRLACRRLLLSEAALLMHLDADQVQLPWRISLSAQFASDSFCTDWMKRSALPLVCGRYARVKF
jgi:hypothetical protein